MSQSRPRIAALAAALLLAATVPLAARDFPEPPELSDPWLAITAAAGASPTDTRPPLLLAPAAYGDLAYHGYTFLDGPHDSFSVRTRVGGVPVAFGPVALGLYWSSFLLVGPIEPTDDAASIAEWWMNAVQFEYGLIAAVRLPRPFRSITLEYGRTSQHPLRSGYSEISSDVVSAGVWLETLRVGGLCDDIVARPHGQTTIDLGLRASWIELYDFWESDLLKPRTRLRIAAPVEIVVDLIEIGGAKLQAVLAGEPRLLFLRSDEVEPGTDLDPLVQMELDAELGLRVRGRAKWEVAVELYSTHDTEQRRTEPSPLTTLGIVTRIGN